MHISKYKRSIRGFGLATAKEIEGRDRAYYNDVNTHSRISEIQSVSPIALAAGVDVSVMEEIKERLICGSITYLDVTDWGIPNPEAPAGVLKHCDPASPFFNQSKLSCRDRLWLKTSHPMLDHKFEGRVFTLKATYRYSACYTVVVNSPEDIDRIREWVDDLNEMGQSWIDDVNERVNGPAEFDVEGKARRLAWLKEEEDREMDEAIERLWASPEGQRIDRSVGQESRERDIEWLEGGGIPDADKLPPGGIPEVIETLKAECEAYALLYDRDGRERVAGAVEAVKVKKAKKSRKEKFIDKSSKM